MKLILKRVLISSTLALVPGPSSATHPNMIVILADDLGIGDVKCYGKELCKVDTPHMDQLARKGMQFTDAHTSSSVCTPTRYGLLTGRYNWRSTMKKGVLNGFSKALIPTTRETIPAFLKKQGYRTGCVGKWHLGMDFPTTNGKPASSTAKNSGQLASKCNVKWDGTITNGPTALGFDYYFGISASLDYPPYIWIENGRFVGKATAIKAFHRPGPAHKDFEDYDVLPTITRKSVEYIGKQSKGGPPFFLYVALNSPHTPISPSKAFQGKSALGPYGDFVMETDWSIGQIVQAIEREGLAESTLIIVTSDNGCSPAAQRKGHSTHLKFNQGVREPLDPRAHYANAIYRGHKADVYEGGHRVPFIVRWDEKIKVGSTCDLPICLTDIFATAAEITGASIADASAEDSVSFLPHLLGTADKSARPAVVHHSMNGSFSIRQGKWKLLFCPGSGGWSNPSPGKIDPDKLADEEWVQLYDLKTDPAETENLSGQHPETVKRLTSLMNSYIAKGRSTPGAPQKNDGGATHLYPKWIREKR